MPLPYLHLAGEKIASSRYVRHRAKNQATHLDVFLDKPRDVKTIIGKQQVQQAIDEICNVFDPPEDERFWTEI